MLTTNNSEQNLTITDVNKVADIMFKSGYFPDVKSLAQAAVKIMAGKEFGLTPFESMQCVYIINGKPSLSGHTWASKIKGSAKYDYKVIEWNETKCILEFIERPNKILGKMTFTLEDAKRAQLIGKAGQMWEKYPKQMLFNRCLTAGARIYTPDVLNAAISIYTPEELSDYKVSVVNTETGEIIENNPIIIEGNKQNNLDDNINEINNANSIDELQEIYVKHYKFYTAQKNSENLKKVIEAKNRRKEELEVIKNADDRTWEDIKDEK